jgi:hypothetical protein
LSILHDDTNIQSGGTAVHLDLSGFNSLSSNHENRRIIPEFSEEDFSEAHHDLDNS